jgi:hypothetical protein
VEFQGKGRRLYRIFLLLFLGFISGFAIHTQYNHPFLGPECCFAIFVFLNQFAILKMLLFY